MTNDDTTRTPGEQYGGAAPDLEQMQRLVGTRYRLQWVIGHGGMSTVWLATDACDAHAAPVAIKILKPEYSANAEFRERFHNEATAAALITNPHVVKTHGYKEVIDAGRTSCFIVMEYVRGESLADVLARAHRLPEDQALTILSQAADGLAAIHNAGMIHRDIKPGNVLITSDGTVKIADFGIAKAAEAVPLTRTGMVVGTAQYVSPEQAQGLKSTPATDIYSLGIVGYEMLTGQRPFQGDTSVAIALAHINNTPPALPDAISRNTRELIATMLRKDPAARYGTGAALSRAIASVQAGFPPPPPQAPTEVDPTAETSVFPGIQDVTTRTSTAPATAETQVFGAAGAAAGGVAGAAAGTALGSSGIAGAEEAGQGYGAGRYGSSGDGTSGFPAAGPNTGVPGYGARGAGNGYGTGNPAGAATHAAENAGGTAQNTGNSGTGHSAAKRNKATTWLLALGVILLVVILAVALWLAWGVNRTGDRDNTGQVVTATETTTVQTTTSAPTTTTRPETTSNRPSTTTQAPRSTTPTTTTSSSHGSNSNGNSSSGNGNTNPGNGTSSGSGNGSSSSSNGSNGNGGGSSNGSGSGSNSGSDNSNGSGQGSGANSSRG